MDYWNDGIMECWTKQKSVLLFLKPIIPLLQYSIVFSFASGPIVPVFHHSSTPFLLFSVVQRALGPYLLPHWHEPPHPQCLLALERIPQDRSP